MRQCVRVARRPEFAAQVRNLAPTFETIQGQAELVRAVGTLYMVCRSRAPVMAILRRSADPSAVGSDRRPPSGRSDDDRETSVREVVNRFQSLLAKLQEMEPAEGALRGEGLDQPEQE